MRGPSAQFSLQFFGLHAPAALCSLLAIKFEAERGGNVAAALGRSDRMGIFGFFPAFERKSSFDCAATSNPIEGDAH
ncbi:hypothetical protein KUV65_06590 [Maritalea mobilis]|uniref:hypothetical protein n=1 Tax=Maritalea mobilis TaxID=483324 RepID=UPI001C960A7A|nr:hypothetical protein [Maritalea mobilis]MBY6201023.1 hypothetical protein [Maritalea mobilis]